MKYRKKPVVIEAEQFNPKKKPWPDGVYMDAISGEYLVDTLEGTFEASPMDFIITGVKGEKYPCKPDIFKMTYYEVSEKTPIT